jgi:ribosome-binding protein aMBF1 (putative translation factor)
VLRAAKPVDRAYPTELRSIGDHVRKRRLDRGLLQREVALRIGVDKTTVHNWEVGIATPNLRVIPGVIRFLGFSPLRVGKDLGERLRLARETAGLSHRELAKRLRVDPSTILDWERGRHKPTPRLRRRVEGFIQRVEAPRS